MWNADAVVYVSIYINIIVISKNKPAKHLKCYSQLLGLSYCVVF